MNQEDFRRGVWLSSLPLVRIGPDLLPCGIASGCLVSKAGRTFVLSVSHALVVLSAGRCRSSSCRGRERGYTNLSR